MFNKCLQGVLVFWVAITPGGLPIPYSLLVFLLLTSVYFLFLRCFSDDHPVHPIKMGLVCEVFNSGLSFIHPPTTHDATDSEFHALSKESGSVCSLYTLPQHSGSCHNSPENSFSLKSLVQGFFLICPPDYGISVLIA